MDGEMGDDSAESYSHPTQMSNARILSSKNKLPRSYLVATASEHFTAKALNCITSVKKCVRSSGAVGNVVEFLITTAALEIVRRFSRSKCPLIWQGLQALQVICYPPFKWLQRWFPFKPLAKEMRKISGPMLCLSIATVFSDDSSPEEDPSYNSNVSQTPESQGPDACQSERWLLDLHNKLRMEDITLPERLNDDEIRRFYASTKGDFQRTLSLVKKTIQWRQSYTFLSPQELQAWSHLVFWHGYDLKKRPCLIIRLGLACSNLRASERDFFAKVIVSQIEHGVVSFIDDEHPQIVVLMDCEGLSPFGFPVQMMRSCATLLQDHYPNCLGLLIVVRIPHVAQVVMQTLFQVLRPSTRQKVMILGRIYQDYLSNNLETVPSFLGGNCICSKCSSHSNTIEEEMPLAPSTAHQTNDNTPEIHHHSLSIMNPTKKPLVKIIAIGVVMVWILFAIILGTHYSEWVPPLYWRSHS
nr:phosphatidylinositol/phosphatidylcholine transfer protein SFH12-like [Ipomoea batatas]